MEVNNDPGPNFVHGFTLLCELNSQRGLGHFCDCVLQIRSHPGKVFLAHKSVLAAFSPVLASLLPRHGPLLDLNLPYLTLESLDLLLDYMYTGKIPTPSQEEPVLSAAVHLQMDELLQALRCRQNLITDTVQDKPNNKRLFAERQSLDEPSLASPSYYQYSPERPVPSSPSYEVVPVICRAKSGKSKALKKSRCHDMAGEHGRDTSDVKNAKNFSHHRFPPSSQNLDKGSLLEEFLETSQVKQDKILDAVSQNSQSVSQFGSCGSTREFRPTIPENGSQSFEAAVKDQNGHYTHAVSKHLLAETECGQSLSRCLQFNRCISSDGRCISGMDNFQPFNSFETGKGDHLEDIFSGTFHHKTSYNTDAIVEDRSHFCGRFSTASRPERKAPSRSENSSSSDASEIISVKRTSLPETWQEIGQTYNETTLFESRPLEVAHEEKIIVNEKAHEGEGVESYDFPNASMDCVNKYQGQLKYHCLLEQQHPATDSSDSDSDRGCQVGNTEAKNPTPGLVTIDITEIALSNGRTSQDPKERTLAQAFQCSLCNRVFNHRGSLNRHMRAHLGVRPYSCPQCPMTFSRQYRVAEHMRIHQRTSEGLSEGNVVTVASVMDT